MTNRAPLVAAVVLLLLPVLYLVAYVSLVVPEGHYTLVPGLRSTWIHQGNYRWSGQQVSPVVFWPLEQVDRKLRASRWEQLPDILQDRSPNVPLSQWKTAE